MMMLLFASVGSLKASRVHASCEVEITAEARGFHYWSYEVGPLGFYYEGPNRDSAWAAQRRVDCTRQAHAVSFGLSCCRRVLEDRALAALLEQEPITLRTQAIGFLAIEGASSEARGDSLVALFQHLPWASFATLYSVELGPASTLQAANLIRHRASTMLDSTAVPASVTSWSYGSCAGQMDAPQRILWVEPHAVGGRKRYVVHWGLFAERNDAFEAAKLCRSHSVTSAKVVSIRLTGSLLSRLTW